MEESLIECQSCKIQGQNQFLAKVKQGFVFVKKWNKNYTVLKPVGGTTEFFCGVCASHVATYVSEGSTTP